MLSKLFKKTTKEVTKNNLVKLEDKNALKTVFGRKPGEPVIGVDVSIDQVPGGNGY